MTNDEPDPGSPEATAAGCTCPVADNHNGAGMLGDRRLYTIAEDCPIHA